MTVTNSKYYCNMCRILFMYVCMYVFLANESTEKGQNYSLAEMRMLHLSLQLLLNFDFSLGFAIVILLPVMR